MSIESVVPSNHLIFCHPLLFLPSIFPSIRVFSNESVLHIRSPKYWNFSFNISLSNEYSRLISFRMDWLDLLAVQGTLKSLLQHHSSEASILWCSVFFMVQLSHPYMTTGKTIALTRWTFVGKVMSLLLNMLSRLVITFNFPGGSDGKASVYNAGDLGLSPGLGRSLGLQGNPTSQFWRRFLWDFFGENDAEAETPVLWPPHAKSWLIGKDSDAGRDWEEEEKGMTEDEMAGWHHWLNGSESEWTLGVGDGQGGLACCGSWGLKESDTTERLNWTEPRQHIKKQRHFPQKYI